MPVDFSDPWPVAASVDVASSLRNMCCPSLQFMWDNHILTPRTEWTSSSDHSLSMGVFVGFKVRRGFFYWRRDDALYECPFCKYVFARPIAYRDFNRRAAGSVILESLPRLPDSLLPMQIPKQHLEDELAATKKRCVAGWPPKD